MTTDSTPDVTRLLPLEAIALGDVPTEKRAAIEFLTDRLAEAGRISDRQQVLTDLLEREAVGTTGFGFGIAIPHAQTDGVTVPSIAFARSFEGVDFGAADGDDATLLFTILVPTTTEELHLTVLASLSRALVDDSVRRALLDAETPDEIHQILATAID